MTKMFLMQDINNLILDKNTSLCKPFNICTANGYIVNIAGPFNGNLKDVQS